MHTPKNTPKSWLTSRWFLITIVIIFVILSVSLIKELVRSYQVNQDIEDLGQRIAELEFGNEDYRERIEYLKTDSYFEEQARLKLGLKAPGERVIVLQDEEDLANNALVFNIPAKREDTGLTNPQKWVRYFLPM